MVVSEIKERLSPNMAPPTTVPAHIGRDSPPLSAAARAIGAKTVMVPTLVPMAMEIRQAMIKSPITANFGGIMLNSILAVLCAPPAAEAIPLKAPDRRQIKSIIVILSSPMPRAQRWIFSFNESPLFCAIAMIRAMPKATTTDMI